jgi:hypothetical protein
MDRVYVYHEDLKSIELSDRFFGYQQDISITKAAYSLIKPIDLWPKHDDRANRNKLIVGAVECLFYQRRQMDPTWCSYKIQTAEFSEKFWHSLDRSDMRGEEERYRNRILDVLLQVLSNRDIDVSNHAMTPQNVRIGKKTHRKWNAYVFKMGFGTDARCSRIYYANTADGYYIDEFEIDAH